MRGPPEPGSAIKSDRVDAVAPSDARCRHCGSAIGGLQVIGRCPSCGEVYDALKLFPIAGARNPYWRLPVPWICLFVTVFCVFVLRSGDLVGFATVITVVVSLIWFVVTLVYGKVLAKEHLPPERRSMSVFRNYFRIGGLRLVTLAIGNLVLPIALIFGLAWAFVAVGTELFKALSQMRDG